MRGLKTGIPLALALAIGVGVGCESEEHHSARASGADKAITSAESSGAEAPTSEYLRSANESREEAAKIETEADSEKNAAHTDLETAQKRAKQAETERSQVDAQLAEARKVHDENAKALATVPDSERSLARAKLDASDAEITVLEEKQKCCDLESKDSDLSMKAAQARIETADERSKLSISLYTKAERDARAAEAEKTQQKMKETPAATAPEEPKASEPSTPPAKTE